MKNANRLGSKRIVLPFAAALVALFLVAPSGAQLTSPGNNAVYNRTGGVVLSPAFIDVSIFLPPLGTQATDICDAIFQVLKGNPKFLKNGYPSTGAVVDTRGISGTTNLTCTQGTPWAEGSTTVSVPSTILLPATGGATPTPIIISSMWILPVNTHLIGEGDGIPSSGSTPGTTIQAASGFSGTMIQFGSSPPICPSSGCTGISVEKLTLDGQGQSINGIGNGFSQDFSYVDHVGLYQILGTGLSVSGTANNSGPYSNITFDTGASTGPSSTVCASINGLTGTRGIQRLSCD
jgi:hypothetical protein